VMPVPGCRRSQTALNIAVEVNHIVIPAKDKRATAELLAYVLGLEVEGCFGEFVRIRGSNGLRLDFSEPTACWAFQCALLVSDAEFDAALSRIDSGAVNFYAEFDRTGFGDINWRDGSRCIYFDDPNGHLFELIEQLDESVAESRIRAVAIKLSPYERSTGSSR
jgi:catechol 2,3-dioxygenase-like lactoylglutathione lyase family enzyme